MHGEDPKLAVVVHRLNFFYLEWRQSSWADQLPTVKRYAQHFYWPFDVQFVSRLIEVQILSTREATHGDGPGVKRRTRTSRLAGGHSLGAVPRAAAKDAKHARPKHS